VAVLRIRIQDPGSGAFLTPGSGIGKISRSGSGKNITDPISVSLEIIFWVKILKFFDADPGSGNIYDPASGIWDRGSGMKKFGSGMEKNRIRDQG
jgi:hypothetical protein